MKPSIICTICLSVLIALIIVLLVTYSSKIKKSGGYEIDFEFQFNEDFKVSSRWTPSLKWRDYRRMAIAKEPTKELQKWNDKIWLYHWLSRNNIPGPNVIWFTNNPEFENDLRDHLESRNSYCLKPSHLSESQCILIVRNGVLEKDVRTQLIKDVPSRLSNWKRGKRVDIDQLIDFMKFAFKVNPSWTDKQLQGVPSGILIENIHSGKEIKVFTSLGKPYCNYQFGKVIDKERAYCLARKASNISGLDFGRIDITVDQDGTLRVSEFTWNPSVMQGMKKQVNKGFERTALFHCLKQGQQKMSRMLKSFDALCQKYGLKYWAVSGTLIGALRHKGWIPWDADVDLGMLREDFEKLKFVKSELPEGTFLQYEGCPEDPFFKCSIRKIRDIKSCYLKDSKAKHKSGLQLDIFIFDRFPPGNLQCEELKMKFDRKTILPLKRGTFEDFTINLPNDPHTVASAEYPDYMSFPPPNKRTPHEGPIHSFKSC